MTAEYEQFKIKQKWFRDQYLEMFLSLLPKGFIWLGRHLTLGRIIQDVVGGPATWEDQVSSSEIKQDSVDGASGTGDVLARILSTFAAELARVEGDAWKLVNETDPGVATDLLPDWEKQLGLPEECFENETFTTEERQTQAHLKLFSAGQITTHQWYIDYAADLGFGITIVENPVDTNPFICGVATCNLESVGGRGGYSNMTITVNTATSDITILSCALNHEKQAHVIITYVDAT